MSGRSPYATRARRRQLDSQSMMMAVDDHDDDHEADDHDDHDDDDDDGGNGDQRARGSRRRSSPRHSMGSLASSTGMSGSTFRLGQSLVQARLSLSPRPPSLFSLTPTGAGTTGTATGTGTTAIGTTGTSTSTSTMGRTFFGGRGHPPNYTMSSSSHHHHREDRDPVETVMTAATTGTGDTTRATTTASSSSVPADVRDGIDVAQLRQLTLSCLRSNSHMGAFYASILYSKTQECHDALLYARALFTTSGSSSSGNGSPRQTSQAPRVVRLLEQAGLLSHSATPAVSHTLRLEAVLLAAQALAELHEWTALLTLVEDPHLYALLLIPEVNNDDDNDGDDDPSRQRRQQQQQPHPTAFLATPPLMDDDDVPTWQALAHVVPLVPTEIHPIAQLLYHRGQAYAETGHPLRAATFFQLALQTDPKCLAALDGLLQDNPLVSAMQAMELLQGLFAPVEQDDHDPPRRRQQPPQPPPAWLHDLYLARIHVAAPTMGNPPTHLPMTNTTIAATTATTTATMTATTNHHRVQFLDTMTAMSTTTTTTAAAEPLPPPDQNRTDSFWKDASSLEFLTPIEKATGMEDTDTGRDMVGGVGGSHADSSALDRLLDEYKLHRSPDVLAMAAQRAFRLGKLNQALEYCQRLTQLDPLCTTAAYVHVATLVALGQKRALFRLAHEWIEASPQSATSWFAVGSYYYACARYHVAQRHFCRATRLDPQVVAAWMAFGCSFAAVEESDQALASFRAAQRLAPGDATSLLYIGMEYLRTNHTSLAQHFLTASHQIHASALVQNELGVYCLREKYYEQAATWFVKALKSGQPDDEWPIHSSSTWSPSRMTTLLESVTDPYWESTIFNLAYALRKMRRFDTALVCLERSCSLCPDQASAWSARGFVCHLDGDVDQAIDFYHQALACKPKDPFSSEMLQRALIDALAETSELLQNIGLDANRSTSASTSNRRTSHPPAQDSLAKPPPLAAHHGVEPRHEKEGRSSMVHPSSRRPRDSMAMSDDGLSISVETLGEDVDMG